MPYALKEGGWSALLLLFSFGIITLYTGVLLKRCLENSRGVHTYPDIGQAAFGTTGRILLSVSYTLSPFLTDHLNLCMILINCCIYISDISLRGLIRKHQNFFRV